MNIQLRLLTIFCMLVSMLVMAGAGETAQASSGDSCREASDVSCSNPAQSQAASPEQQLADLFSPIVYLKRQAHECDRNGEAYLPAPVEIVFDGPDVTLERIAGRGRTNNETLLTSPGVDDLMAADDQTFLDFPGNPRRPQCDYERWFKKIMAGHEPVVYANVIPTGDHVVIQYWFWYVFNDFNNTHEGDWEMIQLVFEASSVAEALGKLPVEVGYSSHGGGERADWDDDKLEREGAHPVVYPGAGSHANKFGSGVYLAWGEDNSGFGCDVTTGPSNRIEPAVILMPNDLALATGPSATIGWLGRWGERQPAFYNGPESPGVRERWTDPFPWQDGLRDGGLKLPESMTFGPGPTSVFCTAVEAGSFVLTRWAVYPSLIIAFFTLAAFALFLLIRNGWSTLKAAWRIYLANWHVFSLLGLMLIPIGFLSNAVQFLFVDYPPGEQIFETLDSSPGARLAIVLTVSGLQDLLSLIVIGPAVVAAVGEIWGGRTATFFGAYRIVFRNLRTLIRAVVKPFVIVTLLSVSIIGIPWAIAYTVRWLFVTQAVLLDRKGSFDAMAASRQVVEGHWWRTAATSLLLSLFGVAPAPLIGLGLLIFADAADVRHANWVSSFIYAVMLPIAIIGMTVLYRRLKGAPPPPITVADGQVSGDAGVAAPAPAS